MNGNCVSCRSVKQSVTALSTAEAEYVTMSMCVRAIARVKLLKEIGEDISIAQVWEDNQPAISWAERWGMRTKHIYVRYHYIREQLSNGIIAIGYCPTDKMQADALTKPVPIYKLLKFVKDVKMTEQDNVDEQEC